MALTGTETVCADAFHFTSPTVGFGHRQHNWAGGQQLRTAGTDASVLAGHLSNRQH
jgi:hypothetical protein